MKNSETLTMRSMNRTLLALAITTLTLTARVPPSPLTTDRPRMACASLPPSLMLGAFGDAARLFEIHKQPMIKLILVVAATLAFGHLAVAKEDATPVETPELQALRADYESKLAPIRAKLNEATAPRTRHFVTDLTALETQLSKDGKNDAVLIVRAERDAYSQNHETVGFDPKNKGIPPALLQLRLAYDRDLLNLRVNLSAGARNIVAEQIKKLDALERQFASQNNAGAILAVRAERERTTNGAADPLRTFQRNPVGVWKWSTGETRTFSIDGTWKSDKKREGSWAWTNIEQGQFNLNEPKHSRAEMVIESDGTRMSGRERGGGGPGLQVGQRLR
jgi:hypothetical protein